MVDGAPRHDYTVYFHDTRRGEELGCTEKTGILIPRGESEFFTPPEQQSIQTILSVYSIVKIRGNSIPLCAQLSHTLLVSPLHSLKLLPFSFSNPPTTQEKV